MRTRIRALVAVSLVALASVALAAPAHASESPEEKAKECIEKLVGEGTVEVKDGEVVAFNVPEAGSVDDCQKAPLPILPATNEIIWGTLAFLVLLVAMWKWGVPAVKNMEAQREERIRNDLEGAERARAEAEAEKAQYESQIADSRNEGGRIIEEARQSAEQVRRDLIARAEAEAEEIRARAQADIANQQAQAMSQLQGDVANLAIDLAGRVVEKNLDNDTNRQLVDSFIEQVGRSN